MTLIVASRGLIIADSLRMVNDEATFKTGKIFPYDKPVFLQSKAFKFKDYFFGYAGSGEDAIIKAAGQHATTVLFDAWVADYRTVDKLRCLLDTGLCMMFFGLKGILAISIHSGEIRIGYLDHRDHGTVITGSGLDAYIRIVREFKGDICPVKASYATFAMEPSCGGAIEVWKYPLSKKERMTQIKIHEAINLPSVFKMAASGRKHFYQEINQTWLTTHTPNSPKYSPTSLEGRIQRLLSVPSGFQTISWKTHLQGNSSRVSSKSQASQNKPEQRSRS